MTIPKGPRDGARIRRRFFAGIWAKKPVTHHISGHAVQGRGGVGSYGWVYRGQIYKDMNMHNTRLLRP